jgi:hypothetical protein
LTELANLDLKTGWAIIHDIGDVYIANSIGELLDLAPFLSVNSLEDTKYALRLYDVNRINRNQLTHFLPFYAGAKVQLLRMKGPHFAPGEFDASLDEIRRVADEIRVLEIFLSQTLSVLGWQLRRARNPDRDPGPQPSSPSRPPLPERLWRPPPQGQP